MQRSMDFDARRTEAKRLRGEFFRGTVHATASRLATPRVRLFASALVVATAAFWAVMLTVPPTTEAALKSGFDIGELHRQAPTDLPALTADAI